MNENFASLVNSLDFLYEQHKRRTFSFKKTRNMTPLIKCAVRPNQNHRRCVLYFNQNCRQKVVNRGALRSCGGASRLCKGGLTFKFDKNALIYSVSYFNLGCLELCLGGLSLPNPPWRRDWFQHMLNYSRHSWKSCTISASFLTITTTAQLQGFPSIYSRLWSLIFLLVRHLSHHYSTYFFCLLSICIWNRHVSLNFLQSAGVKPSSKPTLPIGRHWFTLAVQVYNRNFKLPTQTHQPTILLQERHFPIALRHIQKHHFYWNWATSPLRSLHFTRCW